MKRLKSRGIVSVPLRGLWFLSAQRDELIKRRSVLSFRPLAGIMVLIKVIVVSIMGRLVKRFRPLAGIMVLIGMILYAYCKEQLRFRPLAGIMVLITGTQLLNGVTPVQFPSPCGDYGSYHL